MVGNSAEEGLMQQVGNPSHTDIGRIVVPAGLVAGVLVFFGLERLVPILGLGSRLLLACVTVAAVALWLHRWLTRRQMARKMAALEAEFAERERETERKIAEMKRGLE